MRDNIPGPLQQIRLIAIDLDGTLLTTQGILPPEGTQMIKKLVEKNIYVVLATTRNSDHTRSFCRELDINDPMICSNGSQVWGSPDGPIWITKLIPQKTALAIANWADQHGWELCTTIGPMTYFCQRPGQALGPLASNITVAPTNQAAIRGDATRILVYQPDAIESISALCQSRFAAQCRTEYFFEADASVHSLGIFPVDADKGTALNEVLGRLELKAENALAIGDNVCDLAMFAAAGTSVAMDNAPAEVKAAATVVAPSNDEEGVAWAIQQFVLRNL